MTILTIRRQEPLSLTTDSLQRVTVVLKNQDRLSLVEGEVEKTVPVQ